MEKLLAVNVKETQQRVWNGVTKDISYLRKILNEVYMLKFKVCFYKGKIARSTTLIIPARVPRTRGSSSL